MRYKLTLEYDGSRFCGWQRQDGVPTVQQTVEDALSRLTHENVEIFGAGRTDAGVHALGQVAHCDLASPWDPFRLVPALNHFLQFKGVVILHVEIVDSTFHARFSARSRRYQYHILNRSAPPTFDARRLWHVPGSLNTEAMKEAGAFFVGHHNWNAFRSSHCQGKNPEKTVTDLTLTQFALVAGQKIVIEIESRSFLHNQVRIMVGTLVAIGRGQRPLLPFNRETVSEINSIKMGIEYIKFLLTSGDRKQAGQTAPAHGLYFSEIRYTDI